MLLSADTIGNDCNVVRVLRPLQVPGIITLMLLSNSLHPRTVCNPSQETRPMEIKYLGSMRDSVFPIELIYTSKVIYKIGHVHCYGAVVFHNSPKLQFQAGVAMKTTRDQSMFLSRIFE